MSWLKSLFWAPQQPALPAATPPPAPAERLLEESVPQPTRAEPFRSSPPELSETTRPNKGFVVLGAGAVFFGLSLLTTRRAFVRRRIASSPAFYSNLPGHQAELSKNISGAAEAAEALSLATLNVFSLAIVGTGGAMWYWDVNSLADARKRIRDGMGLDELNQIPEEVDEELGAWLGIEPASKEVKESVQAKTKDPRR